MWTLLPKPRPFFSAAALPTGCSELSVFCFYIIKRYVVLRRYWIKFWPDRKRDASGITIWREQDEFNNEVPAGIPEQDRGQTFSLTERIDGIERQLSSLKVLATQVQVMEAAISELQGQVTSVRKQMDDLENRGRRNNLVIYGIEEDNMESSQELEMNVTDGVLKKK